MVELLATSKMNYANTCLPGLLLPVPLSVWQATVNPSPKKTLRHLQANLAQSPVGSLLLSSGSWCTWFWLALQESLFPPGLWKFCNHIPLAFKVRFPRDS